MCVGGLFGGGNRNPAPPQRQAPAPTMKAAAPPPEMVTPEKIKDEQGDEDKLSTKKKKALEIKKVEDNFKWQPVHPKEDLASIMYRSGQQEVVQYIKSILEE